MKSKDLVKYTIQRKIIIGIVVQFLLRYKKNELLLYKCFDDYPVREYGDYGFTIYLNDKKVKHIPFFENI